MSASVSSRAPRVTAVLREDERVTPLELFFDLVFVLALTQCTTLMAATPTWEGLLKGLLVLGMLWWSWVGYAWLTSVVDPEEGGAAGDVRGDGRVPRGRAVRAGGVRRRGAAVRVRVRGGAHGAHIVLFMLASREDRRCASRSSGWPAARRSAPACCSSRPSRPLGCSSGCGGSRWCSTWAGRSCSGPRAGSSSRDTSPSATGRS